MAEQAGSKLAAIRHEAAAWVVRLDRPSVDSAERAAFEAWRDADPRHEVAYEREAAAWARADRLSALEPAALAASRLNASACAGAEPHTDPDPDFLAPPPLAGQSRRTSRRRPTRRRWSTLVAATSVVAVLALGTLLWPMLSAPAYATAIGERRLVMLEDGSRVELNTDSRIVVNYRRDRREVRLERGEVMFDVSPGKRPFVIVTPQTRLSTRQDHAEVAVHVLSDATAVVVREGEVEARPMPGGGWPDDSGRRLASGTEGRYGADGVDARAVTREQIDRRLAWRNGAIDLDGQTLVEAVEEFNRYNTRRLIVADESIAHLRLGGYFRTQDIDGFVRALRASFRIDVAAQPGGDIGLTGGKADASRQ